MLRRSSITTKNSMMSCKRVLASWLVFALVSLVSIGCTTEVDYTLGSEFVPTKQNMELKRRIYRLGEMSEGDSVARCQLLQTRLYQTDSLTSSNLGAGYFGAERSDIYGERRAGFMSQMIFSMALDEERGWGYKPIFDSMTLTLMITDYHGDTTRKHKFNVFEIISNDYFKVPTDNDTTFFINFDPTPYISREPIFTFEYPNQDKGVYVGDMENPSNCNVKLEETPITREYVSRLMLTTDLESTGGYAYDSDSLYVAGNEAAFVERVKGVYIAPADDIEGDGAMFMTDLNSTAMVLYARDRYEEDPTIIRDTAQMVYNFYLDPAEHNIEAGNVSINRVLHNYDNAAFTEADIDESLSVAERPEVCVGYVDGMGGVVTEVWFTDEFIQSLADIALSEKDARVSVNQARMTIYLEGADYDHAFDPIGMGDVMNSAMERVGLYAKYGMLLGILDYPFGSESSNTLNYDGYLNRSLATYSVDISMLIQSLMAAAQANVDENGKVKLDRFSDNYTPANESMVGYRRFYIGPDAAARFGFDRQAIYGMDGEINGERSSAPITLDMTYTIVR